MKIICHSVAVIALLAFCALGVRAQTTASFVTADTSTQGNWMGVYGADGYDLANGPQLPANGTLSYGSYAMQGNLEWTYAGNTADKRALETDAQGDRTAATWYSSGSFSFDVNFTDSNMHEVALYVLDWDQQGRTETVTIVNASNSGAMLNSRSIPNANSSSPAYTNTTSSNFSGGTYLVWNISGHVTITISNSGFPNAVVEGIFFGGTATQTQTAPSITSANNAAFTVGTFSTFTVTATGSPIPSLAVGGAALPTGVNFVDNHNGTGTLSGNPSTNAGSPYQITFTAVNGVSSAAVQNFTFTVNPQVVSTGPSATFLSADTSTEGNWMATYGADGYYVANGPQSPANGTLSYGNYAVQGQSEWTYAGSTTDQRALETDAQGDRTAATWYSGGTFSFDVNFTDTNTHQVALYLLDWDRQGRAETVTVTNYSSGAVLDTRSIPNTNSGSTTYTNTTSTNFGNGTYLVWNISGHATITISLNNGPNPVAAGIFFGGTPTQTQMAPSITSANTAVFTVGTFSTFTVTATGSPIPSLAVGGAALPTGVNFVDNHNGTGTLSGNPSTNAGSPYQITFTAVNGVSSAAVQNFTFTVNPQVVSTGPSATFLSADTSTEGNWMATYGADGYYVANGPQSPANGTLSYGNYAVQGQSEWTYAGSTTDQRALETDAQGDRTAATWYSGGTFSFDVNFTDTNTHQVALYLLDWDRQGRAETVTVTNYSSGAVLDTRSIPNTNSGSTTYTNTTSTNFGNGTYLVWNISGHATITISLNNGPNPVAAGIFFGGTPTQTQMAPSITSANTAVFTVGTFSAFTVASSGFPIPTLGEIGTLPAGVSFVDNGNGSGTLSGTPASGSSPTYSIGFKATNSVSNQTQNFTLTVNPLVVSAVSSAAYVNADTITEGNWIGTYGVDGYDLAGGPQAPANGALSYGDYSVRGESEWTYAASTSDQRAVETDTQGDRVAAAWYGGSYSIDVNLSDSNTHQIALYLLDWDRQGRGETVTFTNYNSGAVLDSRSIPNTTSSSPAYTNTTGTDFGNGTYLIWNVSGHVTITITSNSGPNAVAAGIFFGHAVQVAPTITSAASSTFPVGQPGTFIVTTSGFPTPTLTESGTLPTGVSFVDNGNGTGTLSGTPAAGSNASYSVTFTASNGVSPVFTQNFILTGHAVAAFVAMDTTTQGNWMGTYGSDGYDIAYAAQSLPAYDQGFSLINPDTGGLWGNGATTDPRALEIPGGSRMATEWNSQHFSLPPTFGFDVNFTDGRSHMLALYALDWDDQGRAEMIQVFDANSNALLDTEYVSNFENGAYAIWTVSGHVTINVTETVGTNSVISGVFFGGTASSAINLGITPAAIGLPPEQSQQFSASVGGTSNAGVTWIATAGQGTMGATSGYYTAPSSISGNQPVTITATSTADPQKLSTANVKVTTGGVANFLATDSVTEGSYAGIYGADYSTMIGSTGNVIKNGSLSYGAFNVLGGQTYIWSASTNDPRALGGVASSWNNPTFNINVTDGKLHQLALYALDWDMQGRAETIQIIDTASGATLDSRNIANFSNGTYLIWNISGNITINVTVTSGPNPVISGIFFGGAIPANMSMSPPSVNLSAGQSQQFSTGVNGGNGNATWTITSVKPSDAAAGSLSTTTPGLYTAPAAITTPTTVVISSTSSGLTGSATVILVPHATVSAPTFDTTTQGFWRGRYGSQGYSVAGDSQLLPNFAAFSVSGNTNGVQHWGANTSDPRALQTGDGSGNIAAAWSKNHESFALDVNFTDTQVHQLSIYAVDWDYQGRTESIQILDAQTGQILDTEFLSNFSNGVYLIWHISGHVTINVTNDGNTNPNALSSGIVNGAFFQ